MKKLNILRLISTVAIAAAGVFGIASVKDSKKAEIVGASGSTKTVYVDPNILGLSNCYIYIKNANGTDNGWPGKHISTISNYGTVTAIYNNRSTTKVFHKFDIDTSIQEIQITNSDGSTYWNQWNISSVASSEWNLAQLSNWDWGYAAHHMHKIQIVDSGVTTYEYNPAEWGAYHLPTHTGTTMQFIGWKINGSGTAFSDNGVYSMPTNNINDYNFTAVYDNTQYTVTFKNEAGTSTVKTQTVYKGQSASCAGPAKADEGGKQFTFDKWRDSSGNDKTSALADVQADLTVYASYTVTYKTGRYIAGSFPAGTSDDWTVSGGVYMSGTGTAGEYSGTVTLAYGDMVKIPYYNGSAFEYNLAYDSYDALISSANAYYCFGSNGGSNHEIKCYAAGSYTFYFKDSAYDGEHKISVAYNGSLTAQHLAAKLMNFTEYVGHCGDNDRFPAMRTIYLGLSSSEKTAFQGYASSGTAQFKNAYDRYTAWARALGEDPWSNAKANSSLLLAGLNSKTTNNIAILVIISVVSVGAIGGYFFIRRRKENN